MLGVWLEYRLDWAAFAVLGLVGLGVAHAFMRRTHGGGVSPPTWRLLGLFLLAAFLLAEWAGGVGRQRFRAMLEGMAPTYALELEQLGHSRLRFNTPPDDSLYLELLALQRLWLSANEAVADLRTYRVLPNGRVVVMLDSETDFDRDGSYTGELEARVPLGREVRVVPPELVRAFRGEPGFTAKPRRDERGEWVTAYVSLRDAANRVESVLAADYRAAAYLAAIAQMRLAVLAVVAVLGGVALVSRLMVAGVHAEVARRRRTEQILRQSETRFRTLADGAPVMIWMEDAEGRLEYVNAAWLAFRGTTLDEELAAGRGAGIHPDDLERVTIPRAGTQSGVEYRLRGPSGEYRWIQETRAPRFDEGDAPAGWVGACVDVTDQRLASAELARARDAALASAKFKSEFLANMSHEIRTPMNGVLGMLELLLDTELTPEQRDRADTARRSAEALLTIINDILDFSKIEAGKMALEAIDFDLRSTLDDVTGILGDRAAAKGLQWATLVHPGVPPRVRGDPGRLRQVLVNLAGNAIKFTERGEVVLRAGVHRRDRRAVLVRFEVTDTGIGMTPEVQRRLFQPFTQADSSTTRRFGGTGLGLAICHQFVELMGGEIGVESEPGRGSTFWFTATFGAADAPAPAADPGETSLAGLGVLLADGHQPARDSIQQQLAAWEISVETVDAADRVLPLLRSRAEQGRPLRVALLDAQLPAGHSHALARAIKADPLASSTRLVLLAATGMRGQAAEAQAAGFDAFLSKPVRQSPLHDCLVTLVGVPPTARSRPIITRHSLAEARDARRPRILLAEDNEINQRLAVALLEQFGYRVEVVGTGAEAVAALHQGEYDLVLMDCQMPEMDGYQATAEIRRREAGEPRVPIVAMTANAMEGERERCLAAGMDEYVTKPIRRDHLRQVLARLLGRDEGPGAKSGGDGAETFDLGQLRSIVGDDPETVRTYLALFHETTEPIVARAAAAVRDRDGQALRGLAHMLKGSCGSIGAREMAEAAKALEAAASGQDWTAVERLYRSLETCYGRVRTFTTREP